MRTEISVRRKSGGGRRFANHGPEISWVEFNINGEVVTAFPTLNEQVDAGAVMEAEGRKLITFRIGDQEFCVDIMSVREIRGWTNATALPQSPSYVRGVVNLRGAVLPIVDLSSRLGFADTDPTAHSVIIVAQIGPQLVGLLVDAVSDICTVAISDIQPAPEVTRDRVKPFVQGILAIEGRMITLISLEHVLPDLQLEAA